MMMMAAAATVLAACNNDDETDNWAGEIRLSSGLTVQQTDTRAATDIQGSQFASGEKIDVFISENTQAGQDATTTYGQPLIYTTGSNGVMGAPAGSQPYFPASGNSVNIYAYYPSGKVTDIAATSLTFSVEENQNDDANYKASDLMYGKPAQNPVARTSSPTTLTFTHLLSKVTITLVQGSGAPSLTDAVVTLKNVKPSTTLNPSAGTIAATASGDAKGIIVKAKTNSALSGSAIVVPQTLETSFIEVTLANGGVLTSKDLKDGSGTSINSVALTSGNVYTYTITVNLTSLDITSTITPWNPKTGTGNAEMQQ